MEVVYTAAVEFAIGKLINGLKEVYYLVRGPDGDAQKLQATLGMVQAYLSDAEKKSITQDTVKIWLRKLEAAAFDADDVLDEFNYHLLHKEYIKMKTLEKKSAFFSYSHNLRQLKMADTIKQINANFESMNKWATDFGLQRKLEYAPAVALSASPETDSFSRDPIFIGRDDDVPKLVALLTQTNPQTGTEPHAGLDSAIVRERIFSTVALVGMGGIGKTTLTKKVFHHESVKTRFGSLIWVHVSQTFDPIILFNKILSTLDSSHTRVENSRQVILEKLQRALKDKTYLLILDDVWNEHVQEWEGFINSMKGVTSTEENGIMVTTRSQRVASIVSPLKSHALNGLTDGECWSIIKAKSFDENGEVPAGVETIGRKIAERCKGLPLAANVVGGVLRSKSEEEWRYINEKWLSDGEVGENINKILKLSYDHLSLPSLKKCFAYCSVFPKGKQIAKQQLIELWMGEGFLQPSGTDDMESEGNKFFNVLLQNSLLQQVAYIDYYGNAESHYGNVWSYVMHDLVHDMASSVLGGSHNAGDGIVRYMFLEEEEEEASAIPKEVAKHVRTLFLEGGTSSTTFSDFKCLRNLTLIGYGYEELPNSIRELIHLRNLNISDIGISSLPEWIWELHYLETLNIPREFRKLPSTLKYLINLRHLYIDRETKLPVEIGRLTCLRTLRHFSVGKEKGYQIEELGNLKNLKGKLEIRNLERVGDKEEAMKAKMMEKSNLSELVFKWDVEEGETSDDEDVLEWDDDSEGETSDDENVLERDDDREGETSDDENVLERDDDREGESSDDENVLERDDDREGESRNDENVLEWDDDREGESRNDENVLEGLQPHPNLKKLEIYAFKGKRISLWSEMMAVSEITLEDCSECEEIQMGHLPNLKSLTLRQLWKVRLINTSTSFSDLSSLEIEGLKGLECLPDWLFNKNHNLKKLKIRDCLELRKLPDGLDTLNSLEELAISNCPKLESIGESNGGGGVQSKGILSSLMVSIRLCEGLMQLPMLEHLPNIESVELRGLKKLSFINSSFINNHNLRKLDIRDCPVLRKLPDGLDTLNSLEELTIKCCPNLESIGEPSGGGGVQSQDIHRSLKVEIIYGEGLMELPRQMIESWVPSLEHLTLWGLSSLKNLPVVIDCLFKSSHLKKLTIRGVPKFMASGSVESWGSCSLMKLEIDVSVEWSMETSGAIEETVDAILQGCCNSLTHLDLRGVENWEWVPQSIQHLTTLSTLWLSNIGVEELPQWLGNLSSLTTLRLSFCNKLRRLPSPDALKRLDDLWIAYCPKILIDSEWPRHRNFRI